VPNQFNTEATVTKAFCLGKKGAKPPQLEITLSSDAELKKPIDSKEFHKA